MRAPVSVGDFRQVVSGLGDKGVEVTNKNLSGLSLLCDEFRFAGLSERLSPFWQSAHCNEVATWIRSSEPAFPTTAEAPKEHVKASESWRLRRRGATQ
jgi:hypothetical protein